MDFDAEILIRKYLTEKCQTIESLGVIIPAPIISDNRASFFSNVYNVDLTEQKILETTAVKFCAISILLPFEDENPIIEGCEDAPLTTVTYNFYAFHQYAPTRENEGDSFLTKTLRSYNEFIKAIYLLRTEFLGENTIPNIDGNLIVTTDSLTAGEYIEEFEPSKYFRLESVFGHAINLQLRVDVLPITD